MTRLAPVLLALLAFAVAACGGGDGDGDESPSQQDFAERADEICQDTKQALEGVAPDQADSAAALADAVDRVIEESQNAVDELSDLEQPEGQAGERARAFVNATREEIQGEGIPALEDLRDALENEDEQAAQEAAQTLQEIDSDASNDAARELGANACAED
jgi:hypothetical protein